MLVGHLGRHGREDEHAALEVANYILGGNGAIWKRVHPELAPARAQGHFDARLFVESRGKRGLSNDISSYVPVGFRAPALTYAVTLGRPESIAFLLKIIDDEWRKIREDVSDGDIEIAKGALTQGYFQMRYAGAHATALSFADGTCQQLWDTRELHLVSLDYGGETREVGAIDINIDQDLVA